MVKVENKEETDKCSERAYDDRYIFKVAFDFAFRACFGRTRIKRRAQHKSRLERSE